MRAPRSVGDPVGVNPMCAKASHQHRIKSCTYGGNEISEARRRDVSGCSASETVEPRNIHRRGGRGFSLCPKAEYLLSIR